MKNKFDNFKSMSSVGNFTKNAIEEFENHIVSENNYLEKVNDDLKNKKNKHS